MTGIAFFLKDQNLLLEWAPILAVAGILIYVAALSIGMGPVPWVIMSEIFPIHVKGTAGSFVVLISWLGAWVVSYTFNFLMSWSSPGTLLLYVGSMFSFNYSFRSKVSTRNQRKNVGRNSGMLQFINMVD
ncbi:hypothetical protein P8452_34178 [Trifolium repens]|nr:hypothetical protein P8452_34172 [Trifolium repens]WJX47500.1 hypothetical protein P8452_34178 [Trifolium repens]